MSRTDEKTTVVVVGGGVAGLALGTFLLRSGIPCVVVEKHSREYVEQRQRAGSLDGRGVRMLREWGVGEAVEGHGGGPSDVVLPLIVDGERRAWRMDVDEDGAGAFIPQQVLVRNLIRIFLRDGGDLRFGAEDVVLERLDTDQPRVRYRDKAISCEFVAGADGFQGVSRTAVPDGFLTCHSHEFGYAWLSAMTGVPADPVAVMAVHSRGFAAQITRGPEASRVYLQCPVDDTVGDWPDDRVWDELDARFGSAVVRGPIATKQVVPLRGVVFSPMRYGRLCLLGDAAHLISPMSAEGMSLALHDAEVLARAIAGEVEKGDPSLLEGYSDACLAHVWERQASAVWMTDAMHDSGDASYRGEFRKQVARANLENLVEPKPA
ncbi:4-hydroxybenzoate 3-monooxygenase [Amycolatopsis sp. NPDC004079]|uniref:4-hydroxybenzoate 3-monooxygenase n=1 Tax=Amycolatopsis sp. NPDC004079 TaxID=3154549 RepID=UPI0033A228CA